MKQTPVYITDKAEANLHKPSKEKVVGFGLIDDHQEIILYTNQGRALSVPFDELRIGSRKPQTLFMLKDGEVINKIDIRTVK